MQETQNLKQQTSAPMSRNSIVHHAGTKPLSAVSTSNCGQNQESSLGVLVDTQEKEAEVNTKNMNTGTSFMMIEHSDESLERKSLVVGLQEM